MTLRRVLAVLVLAVVFVGGMTIQSILASSSRTAAPHARRPIVLPTSPPATPTAAPSATLRATTTAASPTAVAASSSTVTPTASSTARPHRQATATPVAIVAPTSVPLSPVQPAVASIDAVFPPATAFIVPIANHTVKTTMKTLNPEDFGGPVKPIVRTEYDLSHSPYVYRVEVFRSSSDAAASYAWQDKQGTIAYLPSTHDATPNEHIYQDGSLLVAELIYRNIELFMNRTLASASPLAPSSQAVQQTLSIERALFAQVVSYERQQAGQGADGGKSALITDTPQPTDIPVSADAPQSTDVPANTDVPVSTDVPASTDTPVAADTAIPDAQAVDAGDSKVQQVLTFQPACDTAQVNSEDIATRVENQEGLTDYIGSSSYPGSFTLAPGQLGSSIVTWTLGKSELFPTYTFRISQDGSHIFSLGAAARSVLC